MSSKPTLAEHVARLREVARGDEITYLSRRELAALRALLEAHEQAEAEAAYQSRVATLAAKERDAAKAKGTP